MTPDVRARLMQRLIREEGRRTYPYQDTKGKLTVGVGWNLSDRGLPDEIIDELLGISMNEAENAAQGVPGYLGAGPERQSVIVAMCFQMGLGSVLRFTKFIKAFAEGDYDTAANEMLDSIWAKVDSPARAAREAQIMRTGVLP